MQYGTAESRSDDVVRLLCRKEADHSLDFATISTLGGEAWKSITPSLKERYEAMAAIEKQAYEEAMKIYLEHKLERDKQRPATLVRTPTSADSEACGEAGCSDQNTTRLLGVAN